MLKKFIYNILIISCLTMFFQNNLLSKDKQNGTITPEIIKNIKANFKDSKTNKALQNVISGNDINKLALNRNSLNNFNAFFKYKVKVSGITNQKKSGRCWMFTGLNVLRPIVIDKLNLKNFEFSTNYLFFWDQFEKANLFLETIIKTRKKATNDRTVEWLFKHPIGDGGVWNLLVDIVNKYGLVPKGVMTETYQSEKTGFISRLIRRKLREDGLVLRAKKNLSYKKLQEIKITMLADIYKMLVFSLGEPPVKFDWRYEDKKGKISPIETYTPKSFYKKMVGINLESYVLFMDDPTRPYNELYEIEYDRNLNEGHNWKFINLPAKKIKIYAEKSIIANEAMYFSCDVGKQLNKNLGLLSIDNYDYESLFAVTFGMDKKARIQTFESGSTHGMALVGVDVNKKGKITKWLLENSWGAKKGHKGYLIMTDKWFDEYMFRLVVNKKFVTQDILKILKRTPKKLPPWDPLFTPDI